MSISRGPSSIRAGGQLHVHQQEKLAWYLKAQGPCVLLNGVYQPDITRTTLLKEPIPGWQVQRLSMEHKYPRLPSIANVQAYRITNMIC